MEYCLVDLGVRRVSNTGETVQTETANQFKYEKLSYTPLSATLDVKSVIQNVRRVPEFTLRERTEAFDSTAIYLGVFLRMRPASESFDYGCFGARQRLCGLLFTEAGRSDPISEELAATPASSSTETSTAVLSVEQFYHQLRLRHQQHNMDTGSAIEPSIPDSDNLPLRVQMRPYQQQAVRWLLRRETGAETLPASFVRLQCTSIPEIQFYRDLYSFEVFDSEPPAIPIPSGGILADEMGMGKTVEILALILSNSRQTVAPSHNLSLPDDYSSDEEDEEELMCLCLKTHRRKTIVCRKCKRLQHRDCMLKYNITSDAWHLCPECWRTEPLVESRATIIVSPVSIKHQWLSEIRRHVSKPDFRVFLYNGVTEPGGWISPLDLASYDVVLTDYNVLKPELYFTEENRRMSRHEKRYLQAATPLTMIRWWRVCLDEAQMVEGVNNSASKMVKALPAVHRWTVTGTPIEKTINNLHGLVHFLDYAPYNEYSIWRAYSEQFLHGNAAPLLTVMSRIMWRTCKTAVLDQLGIPPQTERVHYVRMSDLQSLYYRTEHRRCADAFHLKALKLGSDQSMAKLNIQLLNQLMEPLRKLRLDCTIPSVLYANNAVSTKKLLTPTELHEHLVSVNVNECKSQLRSIVSSLNGMAALHILQQNPDQAVRLYEASLRYANDYTGAICVDSLLQIHALHNLIDVLRSCAVQAEQEQHQQLTEYQERYARLEWRYVDQYASKVRSIATELEPAMRKVEQLQSEAFNQRGGYWWLDTLATMEADSQRYWTLFLAMMAQLNEPLVRSWRGLGLALTNWWERLVQRHQDLRAAFVKLEFFVNNLKPRQEWADGVAQRIETLVSTAFACHLDPALAQAEEANGDNSEGLEMVGNKQPAPLCLLCQVKDTLKQLEAVLYLQTKAQAATGGLWQITKEEAVLKLLDGRDKGGQDKEEGAKELQSPSARFFAYLEAIKAESKEYSSYWVEVNYTVAAYDELNMCKSRFQLISLEEYQAMQRAKKKPTIMQLLKSDLEGAMRDLQDTKLVAERDFLRLQGTLKYLAHLGVRQEIDPCPICQTIPDATYAVLQCGHHFCQECIDTIKQLARARGNIMTCGVCRHQQSVQEMRYVTLIPKTSIEYTVCGNYSAKILKIIETVKELQAADPDVKIVIFSHWESILVKLAAALDENGVTYREKSQKFYLAVDEFKDYTAGVTCLLMPLRFGSKGLNLTEATHVFLVEPILNPGEEQQAVGRVHRIGQTRPTVVHRFIVLRTIEEKIHETIQQDRSGRWLAKDVTIEELEQLFQLEADH
ncbi:E3 ubiquitin-protein ligase SHPRH [Anopheles aquasalis]|uniref:E3 ubiquitin-protein ligase SHPRH n=1 Tax=Anopheles aquasalis TaxID=42839 RepID=UPI00215A88A0|nr:E3 ubiquitin-protein ligase SHPRH [Anopheles aquasalis]